MDIWFQFYSVTATATATLLGLLFVAVSINAQSILGGAQGHTKRLAEQAFQNYVTVLLVSMLAMFPTLSLSELGITTLCVTAASFIWVLIRLYLALTRDGDSRLQALRQQVSSLLGFGMLIAASIRMALNIGDSRNLFAIANVILLFSATAVSWVLLLRIGQVKQAGA